MGGGTWRSVFNDLSEATGTLSGYRLELLNDPGLVQVTNENLLRRCSSEDNEAKAIRDLLVSLTPPSEEAKAAMRRFCEANGLKRLLVQMEETPSTPVAATRPQTPDSANSSVFNKIHRTVGMASRLPSPRSAHFHLPNDADPSQIISDPALTLPVRGLCFGRSKELDRMSQALYDATMRTHPEPVHFAIAGGGGIGKTSLANAVVHDDRVASAFRYRRYWVNLEDRLTEYSLVRSIIAALPVPVEWNLEGARSFLAAGKTLLVLDDLDSLAMDDGAQRGITKVLDLLASCSCLIITLRDVRPLPIQMAWSVVRLGRLDPVSAAHMFCAVADAHADDPDLGLLIEQCDGLPLAIRLLSRQAAAGEPLSLLRRRWDQERHRLLSAQVPGTKFDNLAVSVELTLSHPRLRTDEAAWNVLRLLAPVTGGLSLAQLEILLQDTGEPASLASLLHLGLVLLQRTLSDQIPRYSIVTPIRTYIVDTVRCPPLSLVQDALRILGPFDGLRGLATMRLFELTTRPLVPVSVDLLCVGVFPIGVFDPATGPYLDARCVLAKAKPPRRSTVSPVAVITSDGVFWRHEDITEGMRVPVIDAIAVLLRRFRDQHARRKAGTELFNPEHLRSVGHPEASEPPDLQTPSNTAQLTHSGRLEGTITKIPCSLTEPTFLCFVLRPAPCEVVVEMRPSDRGENIKAELSSPLMREELAMAQAISSQTRPRVSVGDCDRVCAYYSSCASPLTLDILDEEGNRRTVDLTFQPDEESAMIELVHSQRRTAAAYAVALCIQEGRSADAERRLRAEASALLAALPQDIEDLVREVAGLKTPSAESLRAIRSSCRRISRQDGLTQQQRRTLDMCGISLDALERLEPASSQNPHHHSHRYQIPRESGPLDQVPNDSRREGNMRRSFMLKRGLRRFLSGLKDKESHTRAEDA